MDTLSVAVMASTDNPVGLSQWKRVFFTINFLGALRDFQ